MFLRLALSGPEKTRSPPFATDTVEPQQVAAPFPAVHTTRMIRRMSHAFSLLSVRSLYWQIVAAPDEERIASKTRKRVNVSR